jgi:hypothetical protein
MVIGFVESKIPLSKPGLSAAEFRFSSACGFCPQPIRSSESRNSDKADAIRPFKPEHLMAVNLLGISRLEAQALFQMDSL